MVLAIYVSTGGRVFNNRLRERLWLAGQGCDYINEAICQEQGLLFEFKLEKQLELFISHI